MKNGYLIKLKFPKCIITMPYIFTTMKEACAYGEYKYREEPDMISYEIERGIVLNKTRGKFYKL